MSKRVLVVDDNPEFLTFMSEALADQDLEVEAAADVQTAVTLMGANPFDLVVSDKNLPGTSGTGSGGMDLLRYIRSTSPATAVILITGDVSLEAAIEAMRLGAFDFACKPISVADLKARVARALEYQNFLDPEKMIAMYTVLHDSVLEILAQGDTANGEAKTRHLRTLDRRIDDIFAALKSWEQVIVQQMQALANVAFNVEQLKDLIPADHPAYPLVEAIESQVSHRL
ncbi:MAG: response regulator [Thermodesulfobacteriota bacterium]